MRTLPLLLLLNLAHVNSVVANAAFQKTQAAPSYRLDKVRFVGSKRYSQDQLIRASGLKIGGNASAQDFQNAADTLSKTGAFSQVGWRFNGAEAEYQLIDSTEFVPYIFENIVWLKEEDIITVLKKQLPLFDGQVATNGEMSTEVGTQIESILKAKGIQGNVSAMPVADLGGPVKGMSFSVIKPRVEIGAFEFSGASPRQQAELSKAASPSVGTEYRQTLARGVADSTFRPIYLKAGYLRAQIGSISASVQSDSPEVTKILLTVQVDEGKQYRLSALNWGGSDVISSQPAAKLYPLKPGEIANQELLKQSIGVIASAYFSKGFLKAVVHATPSFDEAAQTVAYQVEVAPGVLYHLRKVEFQNLNEGQLKQVKDAWKLKDGDVYDPTYVQTFLVKNRAALRSLDGWSAVWTQKIYDDDKVVDLTVIFKRGGPLQGQY